MNNPLIRGLSIALLSTAIPAVAQDASQRVEVTAVRDDVRSVCAAIDEQLPARLARALPQLDRHALVHVQFRIDGRRVDEVTVQGGSPDTRAATRRAVRGLDCDNGGAGRQLVRFEVLYRLNDDGHESATAQAAPQRRT